MNQPATNIEQADRHDKVIDLAQERFTKMAPVGISFDAEKGYAIQLLENNPYLMKAAMENKGSLLQAITNVASIGLSLNPAKKQAYLIPRNVKIGNNWITKVFLEPSFVGLCDLATQSGTIKWVQAKAVYSSDKFEYRGVDTEPLHTYDPFKKPEERGEFTGVYCIAKTVDGDYLTEMMSAEDVYSIRDRSEAWKKNKTGPWATDPIEMAKKSVVRRAFKMWPKSPEMERLHNAVDISNQNEGFDPIVTSPNTGGYTAEEKAYFDQLIEKHDAVGMFLLAEEHRVNDDWVFVNLTHSFKRGEKGRYQALVNELVETGRSRMLDCVDAINNAADESGVLEIVENASSEEMKFYLEHCDEEACAVLREMQ